MSKITAVAVLVVIALVAAGAYFLFVAPDDDNGPGPGPGPDPGTDPAMFTVTPGAITGAGTIYVSVDGAEEVFANVIELEEGTEATFRAEPDPPAVFSKWIGLPSDAADSTYTLTVSADIEVGAVFAIAEYSMKFTITPAAMNGDGKIYVSVDGIEKEFTGPINVEEGAEVTFTADPSGSLRFSYWTGLPVLTGSTYVLTADGDYDVGSVFLDPDAPDVFMLSPGPVTGTGKVYISIGGSEEEFLNDIHVFGGTEATLRAAPTGHTEFLQWDGLPGASNPYTLTVDDNYDVGAILVDAEPPEDGELTIHFLELGNKFTGDCIYINYGEIDILIDAGSRTSSSATIIDYISRYIQDDTIEYVIATHAHQDHIAGFYSTKTTTGVLDAFTIGTIIDYPRTDTATATRTNYESTRDRLVAGEGTEHYTALQCYNNAGGAQRVYELAPGLTMEILYQPYYVAKSSSENNYSVCVMITQDGKQYLFTGDLESAGEAGLVGHYEANHGGLGHCVLYKGGHHGSSTSSNVSLLNAITPEYVIICTCAGTAEYSSTVPNQFPTQEFIDRIAPYTDKVYITTQIVNYSAGVYRPMNGNVIFAVTSGDDTVTIICSGDDKILKETEWFLAYRTMPAAWTAPGP
ncbi:MAG: MBL fold metallo-hydrolase [Methanomassiliicoccaceae archaeon]|jgi:beta-lactamase superfamily II metal-dependent hydrolase|nr:MBL fold metallo-hydrolase [Methanomassiliicoccaceae archaeon]